MTWLRLIWFFEMDFSLDPEWRFLFFHPFVERGFQLQKQYQRQHKQKQQKQVQKQQTRPKTTQTNSKSTKQPKNIRNQQNKDSRKRMVRQEPTPCRALCFYDSRCQFRFLSDLKIWKIDQISLSQLPCKIHHFWGFSNTTLIFCTSWLYLLKEEIVQNQRIIIRIRESKNQNQRRIKKF